MRLGIGLIGGLTLVLGCGGISAISDGARRAV